jgi:2-polyprenyl-6-methoxyphenol hydroxylase-like FAD-dependent oxidoreductase
LEANPRIRILQGSETVRLIDGQNDSSAGVVVRTSASDGDGIETKLYADFVVDATGRASRAPQWLTQLGYPATKETTVNAFLGYASRLYKTPEGFSADWKCAFVQAAPPERKRGGILFAVEGSRWLLTLVGGGHDYPPKDEALFLEFARSLVSPVIYDAIKNATPLSDIKVHRGTENRLRHFDKLDRQPRNFVALGDAVCAFNPVYGQGMTVAAMGAMTLDSCLRKWSPDEQQFSRRFQKRLAKVVSAPWMLATSQDYRYRETEGGSASRITKFMHRYMDQVLRVSTFDPVVRHILLKAFGMLVPPSALFQPQVSLRLIQETLATAVRPKHPLRSVTGHRIVYHTAD